MSSFISDDAEEWSVDTTGRFAGGGGSYGKTVGIRRGSDFCVVKYFEANNEAQREERIRQRDKEYKHLKRIGGLRGFAPNARKTGSYIDRYARQHPAFSMDFRDGMPLSTALEMLSTNGDGTLSVSDVLRIATALIDPFVAMEDINLAHGDPHSKNILVDIDLSSKRVKGVSIIDFATSQRQEVWTPPPLGAMPDFGAYGFGAPECYGGRFRVGNQVGASANMWSFGALVCLMATGRVPFQAEALKMDADHRRINAEGVAQGVRDERLRKRCNEFAEEKSRPFELVLKPSQEDHPGGSALLKTIVALTVVADPAKRLTAKQVKWLLDQGLKCSECFEAITTFVVCDTSDDAFREWVKRVIEECMEEGGSTEKVTPVWNPSSSREDDDSLREIREQLKRALEKEALEGALSEAGAAEDDDSVHDPVSLSNEMFRQQYKASQKRTKRKNRFCRVALVPAFFVAVAMMNAVVFAVTDSEAMLFWVLMLALSFLPVGLSAIFIKLGKRNAASFAMKAGFALAIVAIVLGIVPALAWIPLGLGVSPSVMACVGGVAVVSWLVGKLFVGADIGTIPFVGFALAAIAVSALLYQSAPAVAAFLPAHAGIPVAQYNLGVFYRDGEGVDQDPVRAAELFEQAAAQGNASAQYSLGVCYRNGEGVDPDPARAAELFEQAAAQGSREAQFALGVCYRDGEGVDPDPARAVELFEQAAAQGSAFALNDLGVCYWYSMGVDQDRVRAAELFDQAAEQGSVSALNNLGECYQDGEGVDPDPARAVELFERAAEQGDATAQYNLGVCYRDGEGIDPDPARAFELFEQAAEQGDASAQYSLGVCYWMGEGIDEDVDLAAENWLSAAEQGHELAQYWIGRCYMNGDGVDRDLALAKEWLGKAAEQGNEDAAATLSSIGG